MDSMEQHDKKFVVSYAPWGDSHGFGEGKAGAAILYASIAETIEAKTILIIGSGAGFVPKVFLENVSTLESMYLVDAYLAETGNGSPLDVKTDLELEYPWISSHREKLLIYRLLSEVFLQACIEEELLFDVIFIDGDHSIRGFSSDLSLSLRCLTNNGAIFFHDTGLGHIRECANTILEYKWVNFSIGAGVGLYMDCKGDS